jgi:pyrrolidone-carboxylate peptidase
MAGGQQQATQPPCQLRWTEAAASTSLMSLNWRLKTKRVNLKLSREAVTVIDNQLLYIILHWLDRRVYCIVGNRKKGFITFPSNKIIVQKNLLL